MMPYIRQEDRDRINPFIDKLAEEITSCVVYHDVDFGGILNYTCTRLALSLMPEKRYWALALMVGIFETIKLEFYRRLVAPYEDEKIEQRGDVY